MLPSAWFIKHGRLLLNIAWWLFIFDTKVFYLINKHFENTLYFIGFHGILASLIYTHSLLIFKLLKQNKFLWYMLVVVLNIIIHTYAYTALIQYKNIHHSGIEDLSVGIICSPLKSGYSFYTLVFQNSTFLFTFFEISIIVGLLAYSRNYIQLQKEKRELELAKVQAELMLIKNQLNPHFLFNTLNNLYSLSLHNQTKTSEMILNISNVMRYLLYETKEEIGEYAKEAEVMQQYIDIELLRFFDSENMHFSIQCNAEMKTKIPVLIWVPILENIFKHYGENKNREKFINYNFTADKHSVNINSSNSFFDNSVYQNQSGLGMKNLKKRLEILYKNKYEVKENIADGKYSITLNITLDEGLNS